MTLRQDGLAQAGWRTESVIQGEFRVSSDEGVIMSTVLGSCVSVALFDPAVQIGGMNHYLLPENLSGQTGDVKYGALAIELLINALLKAGAARANMRAKLFGGARIVASLGDIGARNAEFARNYMRREGFRISAEDLGGVHARRLQFHPVTGSARVFSVPRKETDFVVGRERPPRVPAETVSNVVLF